jgi:hypothetical protein
MIGILAIIAIAMIAGTALSSVVIVSLGVRREEKAGRRLTAGSPGSVASGARAVTGLGVYRARATWD